MKFDKPLPESHEDFQREFREYLATTTRDNKALPDIARYFARWNAREHGLPEAEKAYRNGQKSALMKAASLCFDFNLPVPDWVAEGIVAAQRAVDSYEIRSWDDILGAPHPKGVHLATKRKHVRLRPQVHLAILREIGNGRSIDEGLFEEVGRRFGLGKSLAAQLYYEEQKAIDEF